MLSLSTLKSPPAFVNVRRHPHFEVGKGIARGSSKLRDTALRSNGLKAGRHSDGGGLYLNVAAAGPKSWIFMWAVAGKRREMGLGAYPGVGLAKARELAADLRDAVAAGRDPIAERKAEVPAAPTFGECCDQFLESMKKSWRNEKHRAQWHMTLETYSEKIRGKRVSTIDTEDVLSVLTPIWTEKPETASRLRGRIERVLDFAKARGWRKGENPALWRGHPKNVLPARKKLSRGHHAALPYAEIPAFVARVRAAQAMAARCLEFTILTAARSGEALGATWDEIDLKKAIWTVPANRMKAGKEHLVPLPSRAMELLRELHETRTSNFVFPGQKANAPLSSHAMEMFMHRQKADVTIHGFRSGFRDWCGEETSTPREVAEHALAHAVGDETERAYRRGNALEKRRALMEAWSKYLASGPTPSHSDNTD